MSLSKSEISEIVARAQNSPEWGRLGVQLVLQELIYESYVNPSGLRIYKKREKQALQHTPTAFELCNEIVGKLDKYAHLNRNTSVAVFFNIEFVDVLIRNYKVPAANITFFPDSSIEARIAKDLYKVNVGNRIKKGNFMPNSVRKFDIILMNPPYQDNDAKGNRKAKSDNLFSRFLQLAVNDLVHEHGFLALITPISWMTPSETNGLYAEIFKPNTLHYLNLGHAKKHFPTVGSTFSWYVLQKKKAEQGHLTKVQSLHKRKNYSDKIDLSTYNLDFLPSILNQKTLDILQKVFCNDHKKLSFQKSYEHESRKVFMSKKQTTEHKFCDRHTGSSFLYSSKEHSVANRQKILMSVSGYVRPEYDDGCLGVTQGCFYMLADDEAHGKKIVHLLHSKLYQFILGHACKWSGFNNLDILNLLPETNLDTNSINDQNLYQFFNLHQDEIDFVNSIC